jgi:hypothetical protein
VCTLGRYNITLVLIATSGERLSHVNLVASAILFSSSPELLRSLHRPLIPPSTSSAMARKAIAKDQIVKLIVGAGQASPSPPVGPALGSKGVKSMDFCKV